MQGIEFIEEADALKVDDKGLKNKWRFAWLRELDIQGYIIGTWCRKINERGACFCIVCNSILKYGNNGKKTLVKHSNITTHKKFMLTHMNNLTETLPGAKPIIARASIADRVADQKAVVTAFISEKMLPFSLAPDLVDLAKVLAKDKAALSRLKFSRTSATYINTHGTAKCLKQELVSKLTNSFFSLNIDEGTTNAMDKMINIFVRFYDDSQNMIVTDHLGSRKSNIASSKNIFNHVSDVLNENGLSYKQVISCLLDNCNTMRGCKGGLENLMRRENPNMLDIHGDTIHILHNSTKKFFEHFDGFIEGISSDVYYDIQDSPKAKELFCEIQSLLNYEKELHLIRFIDNRFLQIFTVCERLLKLSDALKTFYFGFLDPDRKIIEQHILDDIYNQRKLSLKQQNEIKSVQDFLSKQNLKNASADRKERILNILFSSENKYLFMLQFYRGVMLQFNSYVKKFQREKPMMHEIHEQIYSLCRNFLSFFIKPECLPNNVNEMVELNYEDEQLQYEDRFLNFGKFALREQLDSQKKWVKTFYKNARKAYTDTAKYMIAKLPLKNKTLIWFSGLHPDLRKKSTTFMALQKFAEALPHVVSDRASLLEEIREYTSDPELDKLEATGVFSKAEKNCRIDLDWWSHVFCIQHEGESKYKLLPVLVKALLTPFSGPLVEGSFNIMDDIITEDRSVMTVQNYEAVSTVKYHLRRKKIKAVDIQPSVDMRKCIHTAHASYKQHLSDKKQKKNTKSSAVKNSTEKKKPDYDVPSTSSSYGIPTPTPLIPVTLTTSASSKDAKPSEKETICMKKPIKRPAETQVNDKPEKKKKLKPSVITSFFSAKNC